MAMSANRISESFGLFALQERKPRTIFGVLKLSRAGLVMQLPSIPTMLPQERPRSLSFLSVVREGLDDLTFEPPAEWSQRTIVGFNAPNPQDYAYPPGVVMMRDTMVDGDTLDAIVERHL